jgi:hypothetical protein
MENGIRLRRGGCRRRSGRDRRIGDRRGAAAPRPDRQPGEDRNAGGEHESERKMRFHAVRMPTINTALMPQ